MSRSSMFPRFPTLVALSAAVVCLGAVPAEAASSQTPDAAHPISGPQLAQRGGGGGRGGMGGGKMGGKIGKMGGDNSDSGSDSNAPGLDPEMMDAFMAMRATNDAMDARGLFETGLRPVYPDGLNCQTGDSFFGSGLRGDGSNRSERYYGGRHGGFDIPARGIDIIAMADGEVIVKSVGDNIGGIKVVLRHAPEDTGLDQWTFTEYKHLKEPSPLDIGAKVRKGTPVGIAWNTGTTGGRAYGPGGHYHLHLSAWYNANGKFKKTPKMTIPRDGHWLDPLAMMRGGPLASSEARDLADEDKQVRFAYQTADGAVHPEGAKIIWPFVCR
ncbi:MAG: M23 family metallopeptidase [Alphaproteobacteria bacterium]|nr:M23 family metallopeptidase [Alphaproteobacteria bacterium]